MRKIVLLFIVLIINLNIYSQENSKIEITPHDQNSYILPNNSLQIFRDRDPEIFLQGNFVEVGIHQSASFGTAGNCPAGFHPMEGSRLGFVADMDMDGWNVGTPNQSGDYFLPGSPEEGWSIEWTYSGSEHTFGNYGRMSVFQIPQTSLTETSSGNTQSAIWEGEASYSNQSINVVQTVHFDIDDLFFVMNVVLTNTGDVTLESVEFMRNVDPDQEKNITGSYTTSNYVTYQPGVGDNPNKALVVAEGLTYGITLGLGTINENAIVSTEGFSNRDPDAILDSPVAPDPSSPIVADQAIVLAYRFDSLAPGQSISFDYAYILNEDDLEVALGDLASVTILQPTGTVSGENVLFQATTDDVPNTERIVFYVEDDSVGIDTEPDISGVFETSFNSMIYPEGNTTIRVIATFSDSTTVEKTTIINIVNSGPPINFITPESGQSFYGADIPIEIEILDEEHPPVIVYFFRETPSTGSLSLGSDNTEPFQSSFDVNDLLSGENVVIKAVAEDEFSLTTVIQVAGFVNHPPEVSSLSYEISEDIPDDVLLTGIDIDGNLLSFSIIDEPEHGNLGSIIVVNDTSSTVEYTPDEDYYGPDSLTFQANDGNLDSNIGTIIINVLPVNDPPEITSSPITEAYEDSLYQYQVIAEDPDLPADTLMYSLSLHPVGMSIDSETGLIEWTPITSQIGDTLVTVRVDDNSRAFVEQNYNITVYQSDLAAPYIGDLNPAADEYDVPVDTNIEFHIYDDDAGVDINSIIVDVHGTAYSIANGNLGYSGTSDDYLLTIDPDNNFDSGQEVTVTVNASDLAFIPNQLIDHSYMFTCEVLLDADFSATPLSGVAPLTVQFEDLSAGYPIDWEWDFDNDGIIDTTGTPNPQWTYEDPATYSVTLTTWDAWTIDNETKTDYITVTAADPCWNFSWDYHDFGWVDIASGATYDLTIYNCGNVPLTIDDFSNSNNHFTVSDSFFTIGVGQNKVIEIGFYPQTINDDTDNSEICWTTNSIGTECILVEGDGYYLDEAPVLTYSEETGFDGTSGVNPTLGSSSTYFEYRIIYTDDENDPPMAGYPKVGIDWNGDGDCLDPFEAEYSLSEVDKNDIDYTDGKEYLYMTLLPIDQDLGYSFTAYDNLGNIVDPSSEGTDYVQGPEISDDLLDISIFANDITFSNYTPEVGEEVIMSATIHNNSDYPAEDITVSFYEEDNYLEELTIPSLPAQSQTTVVIEHVFQYAEFFPMKVVIDEYDTIVEDNELNNFAIRPVVVGDFSIPGSIVATASVSPATVYPSGIVRFYGHASYQDVFDPDTDVTGAQVQMTIHETGQTYTTYTNSNGDYNFYFNAPGSAGTYTVSASITDFTLTGTTDDVNFDVIPYPSASGPDLAIHYWNISWNNSCAIINDIIGVTATFSNIGNEDAEDVLVNIYSDGAVIQQLSYPLVAAGASETFNFDVSYSSVGNHSVGVVLDPENTIDELRENNNSAGRSRYIYPYEPDLTPTDIWFSDITPHTNQYVDLNFRVNNLNCSSSNSTTADIYDVFDGIDTLIGTLDVGAIGSLSNIQINLNGYQFTESGWHSIKIEVDPDDLIFESNESNQTYSENIYVEADLSELSIFNITVSNANPALGDTLHFQSTIGNNGTSDAEQFYVKYYIDEVLFGDSIYVELLEDGTNMFIETSTVWTILDENPHSVRAVVDENDIIPELNEYNNETDRDIGVDFSVSKTPYYPYNSTSNRLNILIGSSVNIYSRIYNHGVFGADSVNISYLIDGVVIEEDIVPYIHGCPDVHDQSYVQSQVIHQFNDLGNYSIEVHADYPEEYNEISEGNNWDYIYINVFQDYPDLEILAQHISPSELNPDPDEPIDIYASFINNGNVPSGPFWINFLVDSIPLGDPVYVPTISAHDDSTVVCTDTYSSDVIGTHIIRVILDEDDDVAEYNELNNEASRAFIVGSAPDLAFCYPGIILSDDSPDIGDLISISGFVKNTGGATANANLNFYFVADYDTTFINTVQFTADEGDSLEIFTQWYATAPFGNIYLEIADSDPVEFNLLNNTDNYEYGPKIQVVDIDDVVIDEDTQNYLIVNLEDVFTNIDETQLNYEIEDLRDEISLEIEADYDLILNMSENWYGNETISITAGNIYGDSVTEEFELIVNPVNDDPVIDSFDPVEAEIVIDQGNMVNLSVEASDVDEDVLAYRWLNNGVEIDGEVTDSYDFYADCTSYGTFTITCIVDDQYRAGLSRATTSHEWIITVNEVDCPIEVIEIIPAPDSLTFDAGQEISFSFSGYDPDGNELIFEWKLNDEIVSTDSFYTFKAYYSAEGDYILTLDVYDNYTLRTGGNNKIHDLTSSRSSHHDEWTFSVIVVPPPPPTDIRIEISDNDAILSWTAVDTTNFGPGVNIAYLIFGGHDPVAGFSFINGSLDTTFVHQDIAENNVHMFYSIKTVMQVNYETQEFIDKYIREKNQQIIHHRR
ncbi:MAG: PKD domain-containing protein [Candidatus Cloacimonetes bacterium]|nr:PKD domain-containing protein [Candidatus Cloacimonadota bacterium]